MSKCEGTRYVRVAESPPVDLRHLLARAASLGLAGVAVLGCMGHDEPLAVSSNTAPSVIVPQTPLDGATVPKYVEPLRTLSSSRVDGTQSVKVDMEEFQQKMLPAAMYANLPAPFNNGTFLWGYEVNGSGPRFPANTNAPAVGGGRTE